MRISTARAQASARLFADRIFTLLFGAQIVLLVVAWLFMPQVIAILAPGFSDDPARGELAIALTRITFPYLLLITLVTLYGGMLNVMHRFASAAAAPIFLNLSMMATLALAAFFPERRLRRGMGRPDRRLPANSCCWPATLRAAASCRGLRRSSSTRTSARSFARSGPRPSARWERRSRCSPTPSSRRFLPAGALSALYYADRLNQLPIGVIGIAIGTVLLPEMSRRLTADDHAGAAASQRRAFDFTLLFSVPFVAAFLTVPDVIMRAMFARGAFSKADAAAAGATLAAYADRPHSVRDDPQRGRDLLCPQGYRDAGEGGADRRRRQCRAESRADGVAGPDRPCARDRGRRLDQSVAGARSLRCGQGISNSIATLDAVARPSSRCPASCSRRRFG